MAKRKPESRKPDHTPAKMGRPRILELNPEITQKICDYVTVGMDPVAAGMVLGIHNKGTIAAWIRRGSLEREGIYADFSRRLVAALGQCELRDLITIDQFSQGADAQFMKDKDGRPVLDGQGKPILIRDQVPRTLKAAQWRLSRRWVQKWGPRAQTDNALLDAARDVSPEDPAKLLAELQDHMRTLEVINGRYEFDPPTEREGPEDDQEPGE